MEYIKFIESDGILYLNVYSRASTELGRLLSNFAHTAFTHPIHGHFESMEGFWHYIKTGMVDDRLKTMFGNDAKKYGESLPFVMNRDFNKIINIATLYKLEQTPRIIELFTKTKPLPLKHCYVFEDRIIDHSRDMFQLKIIENFWKGKYNNIVEY